MLKAVLFDLDNTLIQFDELTFFQNYVPRISRVFSDIMPPDVLLEKLLVSTKMLMNNNGEVSNAEYFMRFFTQGYEGREAEIWSRFIRFYETEFDEFQALVTTIPGVRDVFSSLQKMGVKLVIASNPIWPEIVQMKRLAWAGLGDFNFDLVTHIENMSYCKPRIEYYQQVCQKINEKPDVCLMVGNDPVNDLVVARIAMKTYLVADSEEASSSALALSRSIRDDSALEIPAPDFTGPLSGVPDVVETLLKGRD
jgi:FMN phosphatase YigB (HAD superfamily)